MPTPLSVTVITLNAAATLRQCLESVAWADEIIVVDSGSTDATRTIAEKSGARIIHNDWPGYGAQKNFAVTQAAHNWILSLDADEWLSPELVLSVRALMKGIPPQHAYTCKRCNRFMGRWLRHGEGYPDTILRLFDRRHATWSTDVIHEHVTCATPIGLLNGDLMHESEAGLAAYLAKQNRYTSLQAAVLHQRGQRTNLLQLIFSPLLRFVKFYFIRRGFMDGVPGLVHILIGCFNSFIKYAKLREIGRADQQQDTRHP